MLDTLIRGGRVVDGTGNPGYQADVALAGSRIVGVGRLEGAQAERTIDAAGCIVCPGFIDPHSHTDLTVLGNPTQESTIRQGVTTEIVGNCGIGCFPLSDLSRAAARERLSVYGYDGEVGWSTFSEFWTQISTRGMSANFASFVPHSPVRARVGLDGPLATASVPPDQLAGMVRSVHEAMEAGAIGMSTGLEYESGRFATRPELDPLARAVGEHHGIYASHIRNRDEWLREAVDEFMDLARLAQGRGQLSHLNVRHNTGAAPGAWDRAVETLERERGAGMDVLADATPLTTGDGVMAGILPAWLLKNGPAHAAEALEDLEVRRRLRSDCDRYWRFIARGEWDRIRLLSSAQFPEFCGLTFPEIAERRGTDEWDAYFDILAAAGADLGGPSMIAELFTEEMSQAHIRHPLFLLGADAMSSRVDGPLSLQTRNPLHFSAHVHYLVHHVREVGTLSLEDAIRKMTSMVATRFGLRDRGQIQAGYFADVAVFDPELLTARSTVREPLAYAEGFRHVLVNGVAVVAESGHTGARPGRFLTAAC